jgi:hypothetical protein
LEEVDLEMHSASQISWTKPANTRTDYDNGNALGLFMKIFSLIHEDIWDRVFAAKKPTKYVRPLIFSG